MYNPPYRFSHNRPMGADNHPMAAPMVDRWRADGGPMAADGGRWRADGAPMAHRWRTDGGRYQTHTRPIQNPKSTKHRRGTDNVIGIIGKTDNQQKAVPQIIGNYRYLHIMYRY
jgi:hypothetical protein